MCPITAPLSIGHKNEFNQQNETYFQNLWSIEGPEHLWLTDWLTHSLTHSYTQNLEMLSHLKIKKKHKFDIIHSLIKFEKMHNFTVTL